MPSQHSNILIVGAGIFGTSTAYHLSLSNPSSQRITVLDRDPAPSKLAASTDINKIVRADYKDRFYVGLAEEAIDAWRGWNVFSAAPSNDKDEHTGGKEGRSLYHRSGWVMLDEEGSDLAEKIRRNFREGRRRDETRDLSLGEVREGFGGVFERLDGSGFGNMYWNPGAGWADAGDAVCKVMSEAVGKGVEYVVGEVEQILLMDDDADGEAGVGEAGGERGGVKGVRTKDGRVFTADKVLLATGAWTSLLMSGVEDRLGLEEEMRIERQVRAAGVSVAHYRLSEEEMKRYEGMPVLVYGDYGEILPPTHSRILKVNFSAHFTNTIFTPTHHRISVPPDRSQNIVPTSLKKSAIHFVERAMPQLLEGGREVEYWRLCWDSITPSQNQLITRHPHPKLSNLYLAVGGSFHSWKFLPIIGRYVVNVLEGRSNGEEMDRRWEWKVKGGEEGLGQGKGEGVHEKSVPRWELRDLEKEESGVKKSRL